MAKVEERIGEPVQRAPDIAEPVTKQRQDAGQRGGARHLVLRRRSIIRAADILVIGDIGSAALGAKSGNLVRDALARGARLTAVALGVGAVIALLSARLLENMLFGVSATDPAVFAGVLASLALVALVATWLPARHAVRADPLESLRSEWNP